MFQKGVAMVAILGLLSPSSVVFALETEAPAVQINTPATVIEPVSESLLDTSTDSEDVSKSVLGIDESEVTKVDEEPQEDQILEEVSKELEDALTEKEIKEEEPEAAARSMAMSASSEGGAVQAIGKYVAPQVSESNGSLNYNFPIVVPEGRNGLTPKINLNYNSANKTHSFIVARGWSFDIPYIQRLNKKGTNKLYTEDYFTSSLGGEIIDQGSGVYKPKVENGSFLKYEFVSSTHWKVTAKDGTIYTFGDAAGARQDDPNDSAKVYAWMLEEVEDMNGNTISYSYFKDNGQIYPASISYNQNGLYEIVFNRSTRSTAHTSHASGFKIKTEKYISSIDVKTDSAITSTYDLNKDTDGFLIDVEISGINGSETITLPKVAFEYNDASASWAEDTSINLPYMRYTFKGEDYGSFTRDMTGDGLLDIVHWRWDPDYTSVPHKLMRNTGDDWVEDTSFDLPFQMYSEGHSDWRYGSMVEDLNGDGLPDLVRWTNNTQYASSAFYKNTGSGLELSTEYTLPVTVFSASNDYLQGAFVQDINGDGLPDIVNWSNSSSLGSNWHRVYINNGSGFDLDANWVMPYTPFSYNPGYGDTGFGGRGAFVQDINGDGLPDIVNWSADSSHGSEWHRVYLNTGSGWELSTDFNLPYAVYSFSHWPSSWPERGAFVQDINGDGLPDIINWSRNTSWGSDWHRVYINTGDDWVLDTSIDLPYTVFNLSNGNYGAFTQDVNGDNLADIVNWSFDSSYSSDWRRVYINTGTGFSMDEIENTNEGVTSFEYDFIRQQDDSNQVPFPVEVVSKIITDDNNGNVADTEYEYRGADYYYGGAFDKKFAGFETIEKTLPEGDVEKSYYHQANGESSNEPTDSYAKMGKVYKTELFDSNESLFKRVVTLFTETSTGSGATSTLQASILSQLYDGTSSHTDTAKEYEYDAYGNVLKETLLGIVSGSINGTFSDTGTDEREITKTYTSNTSDYIVGLPTSSILKDDQGTKVSEMSYGYDAKGNMTSLSEWIDGSDYRSRSLAYNSLGLVTAESDFLGSTTTHAYGVHNLYKATTTNPLSQSTTYTYDYSSGKPIVVTDANDNQTKYTYDALDRVIEVEKTIGGSLTTVSDYTYNTTSFPQYSKEKQYLSSGLTRSLYTYIDGYGRKVQTKHTAETGYITRDTLYNESGRVEKQSLPYVKSSSSYSSPTSNSNFFSIFSYDALGRKVNVQTAKGDTEFEYNGLETTVTDAENNEKDLEKDAFGNLIKVTEHNSSASYDTEYEYDAKNNLIQIEDAEGNLRAITYDALGRRLTLQDIHTASDSTFGTWSFTYNDQNLLSTTDPKSATVSYTHDTLGRVLTEDSSVTTGTDWTSVYDSCTNGIGRLCSLSGLNGVGTSYLYTNQGFTSSETKTIDATPHTTAHTYDRAGNILTATHPDSSVTQNIYNTQGLVDEVKQDGSTIATFDYGVHGKVTTQTHANGAVTTYNYNADELYELANKLTTLASVDIQDLSYQYDDVGNITRISSTVQSTSTSPTNTPPTITLNGTSPHNIILNNTFTDPGATATDPEDGDLTSAIVIGGDTVNTAAVGTYTITYNVTDSASSSAPEVTRDVVVATTSSNGPYASWAGKETVTIDPAKVATDLTDYVVYIDLADLDNPAGEDIFDHLQPSGADLRVTKADGVTELPFELVSYSPDVGTHSLDIEKSSSQNASVSDNSDFDFGDTFTVETWFKLEDLPSSARHNLFGKWQTSGSQRSYGGGVKHDGSDYTLQLYTDSNGAVGGAHTADSDPISFVSGVWYHAAFVLDSGTSQFYLNGVDVGGGDSLDTPYSSSADFVVGAERSDGSDGFDGLIKNTRVWKGEARTQSEIATNTKKALGTTTNLSAEWSFDNNYTDNTANGNDLTGSNSPVFSTDVPYGKGGELWVKHTGTLSSTVDTDIYLYAGEGTASAYSATSTYGSEAVWASTEKGRWHNGAGTDSTSNHNDLSSNGDVVPGGLSGALGTATHYDGSGNYSSITDGSQTGLDIGTDDFAIGVVVNPDTFTNNVELLEKQQYGGGGGQYQITTRSGDKVGAALYTSGQSFVDVVSTSTLDDGSDHWVVFSRVGTDIHLYVDGVLEDSNTTSSTYDLNGTGDFFIGQGNGGSYNGQVDDAYLRSGVAIAADQIATEYNNQSSPSTFYTATWSLQSSTNTPPTITLNGTSPHNIILNNTFTDPGATATDPEDGDLTSAIVIGGDTVNTAAVGTYTITYNVTDSASSSAPEVTRDVVVAEPGTLTDTKDFVYDDLYRLTSITTSNTTMGSNYTRTYAYSPIGNITAFNGTAYTYADNGYNNPHAVTQVGATSYAYDNNGNLTSDGVWSHSWNYDNTLTQSSNGTATSTYVYNKDKSRVKLVEDGVVTLYPSDAYEIVDGVAKVNILKDGKVLATKSGTSIEHIHTDHLGGTHIITNNAGTVVKTKDYFPFGESRVDIGASNEDNGFTGYEHDESTGLEYAEARYYNSSIGRFLSQDPAVLRLTTNAQEKAQLLVDPQQLNTYAYARNNPVRHTDPSGEVLPLVAGAVYYGGVALTAWGAYDIASEGVDAYNTGGVAAGLITVGKTAAIEATVGKATKGVRIGKMLGSIGERLKGVLGNKSFGAKIGEHAWGHSNQLKKQGFTNSKELGSYIDNIVGGGYSAKVNSINGKKYFIDGKLNNIIIKNSNGVNGNQGTILPSVKNINKKLKSTLRQDKSRDKKR